MKRIVALLLCVILTLSLVACGRKNQEEQKTPKEIFAIAVEKNEALDSLELDITMDMLMQLGASNISMSMEGKNIEIKKDGGYQMMTEMTVKMLGQENVQKTYYKDGYLYEEVDGQKVKIAMSVDEILAGNASQKGFFELDDEVFSQFDMTRSEDGYAFDMKVDPDHMDEVVNKILGNMESILGGTGGSSLNMENFKVKYVVNKEGYFSSAVVTLTLKMSVQGQEVNCDMTLNLTSPHPGEDVTITFPDFSDFVDLNSPTAA